MSALQDDNLLSLLSELELLKPDDLKRAARDAKDQEKSLYAYLSEKGLLSDLQLAEITATFFKVPFISLSNETIDPECLQLVSQNFAKKNLILPYQIRNKKLYVAAVNPTNPSIVQMLQTVTDLEIYTVLTLKNEIVDILAKFQPKLRDIINQMLVKSKHGANADDSDLPIVELVEEIFAAAIHSRTSDIHFDPEESSVDVRFRIDGVLHDQASLPLEYYPAIVARIKVLSSLRTDEHFVPQDGRLDITRDETKIDVRVSIVPTTQGEKMALRLLSGATRSMVLTDIGLNTEDLAELTDAYEKPHGMILVTGPTGSGKTTTLYSVLKLLNQRNVNIMTVEDPVEYQIPGISQIHVNSLVGLTFAEGLRSIVRQDPDIILVGEIRDKESADIAVNAALTGHLILSSVHTNNASTTFPRLAELGIEPFLTASSVNIIIAQRLVRLICNNCRTSVELTKEQLSKHYSLSRSDLEMMEAYPEYFKFAGKSASLRFYEGKGCSVCNFTGFNGRIGIFEVLPMSENIRKLVVEKADASSIEKQARQNGMHTMVEDGLKKIQLGLTTIAEVMRVTRVSE